MKPYDSDEELERALFALDLEEPPADLRSSILASTIYRPAFSIKPWEAWSIGALLALFVWVVIALAGGGAHPAVDRVSNALQGAFAALGSPELLFWTAVGAGIALWFSQLNLTFAPGALRVTRR